MAGKFCPQCGRQTFFQSLDGRACSKCNFKVVNPKTIQEEAGYVKCLSCGKYKNRVGSCPSCGAFTHKPVPIKNSF